MTRYGLHVGIAFQISDDALDFVADEARFGKAVGADLKEGKRTFPSSPRWSGRRPPSASASRRCFGGGPRAVDEVEEVRRWW